MNIPVLFENENFLVVNKPAGLVVHSDGRTREPTLVDWILERYPNIQGVGENMVVTYGDREVVLDRPGIVHRIDRDTSGVLVIAKTQPSFEYLKQQFKEHNMKKTYQALVYGHLKHDSGIVDQPIGRHTKDFRMKMAGNQARGALRPSVTEYQVLDRYVDTQSQDKQGHYEKYTFVECFPKTGRTHQIRVHFKYLNHPLVADPLYRGKRKEMLGLTRTALHASSIAFIDLDGTYIHVEAPIPADLQSALSRLVIVS
ncbi:RluA family pseudouridine synthase [Patescibacteria group bacterium]|nr:RluA family pseudouridine synthase [Patescibacteria group bacterium]